MSKLEELIEQYCPDGVEYYKIKDVYKRIKGTPITAGKMKEIATPDGSVRIFAGGKTVIDANEKDIPNANITRVPAVLIQSRGVIDAVYYDKPFTFKNEMWAYTTFNQKSVKYLYYILKSNIQTFRDAASGMGALPQISLGVTEEFEIPVPPLPVQEEIVRILDAFTELQAELQKRKQQYNYYLDNLLNFKDINRGGYQAEVRWMKMSEVFETITDYTAAGSFKSIAENVKYLKSPDYAMLIRTTDLKSRFRKGDFIYVSKSAFDYLWRVKMDKECIVMPNVGNCGEIYYVHPNSLPYDNCALAPNAILVRSKLFNNKYLSYCLQVECFQKQLAKITSPVGQSKFNKTELKKLLVPIPSLADQQKIVDILDRFDTITTDLTQGLPAEIEKRRQQYEYYRDKLLTFKRKGA